MIYKKKLERIYTSLYNYFGPQYWWPGDTMFEVCVGAILTQNTSWKNVKLAIDNLKKAKILSACKMYNTSLDKISLLIKPTGYYNLKAKRLYNFLDFLMKKYNGNLNNMKKKKLPELRKELLSINGIGNETADSILLYAFNKPIFVIDAYTKRILERHNIIKQGLSYEQIQKKIMNSLNHDVKLFNEYHALIVALGKDYCKPKPKCDKCPLGLIKVCF